MTQQQVADTIFVSKHTIINWEKGKTQIPYTAKCYLSKLYDLPIDYIYS